MATLKTVIQKKKKDGTYPVYIRITHNRKVSYLKTSMIALGSDVVDGVIKNRTIELNTAVLIKDYTDKLNNVDHSEWSIDDVISFITNKNQGIDFFNYANMFISDLSKQGRSSSANNYKIAVNSFKKFMNHAYFSDITSKKIAEWIGGLSKTARAKQMYPTAIKTIFKAGCLHYNDYDKGIMRIKNNPFEVTKIPKADEAEKRAIDTLLIKRIFFLTPKTSRGELAQDVIKLVFYLVGINTVDLYNLKKEHLKDWKLCYNRSKTKKGRSDKAYIEIEVPEKIRYLFNKYKGDTMLFNFSGRYSNSVEFNRNVNRGLKSYCEEINIDKVDTYTFRHSWATIAQNNCGASDEDVCFALNHAPVHKVTRLYIKTDFTKIDKLNNSVIKATFWRITTPKKLKSRLIKVK